MNDSIRVYEKLKDQTRVVIVGSERDNILKLVFHTMNFHAIPISYYFENQILGANFHYEENAEFALIEGNFKTNLNTNLLDYKPTLALISDISQQENTNECELFIDSITKGGILIYNEDDEMLQEIVSTSESPIRKIGYKKPEYQIHNENFYLITDEGELPLENIKEQEIRNVEGAKWICQNMGIDAVDFYEALACF